MRTLGNLGISVGTSLAFEGEFKDVINSYDTILINLRTIVKGVMEAAQDTGEYKSTKLVKQWTIDDINGISKILEENKGYKPINMIVYNPTYSLLKMKFPAGDFWKPKTLKQIEREEMLDQVCSKVSSELKDLVVNNYTSLPEFEGKGMILTSYPVDLLLTESNRRLYLLERYTGVIKPFNMWYTKLTGSKDLENMPFNKLTITVFGDKSTTFKSSKQGLKDQVKELAVLGKWTSFSTLEKVRATINRYAHPIDKPFFLRIL